MKKQIVPLLALAWFAALPAAGQREKIKTDRPGRTLTPDIAEKGFFKAEIGFEREQQRKEDDSYKHPEADLRFGLSERFELRAELTGETQKHRTTNDFRYGLKPLELGFKAKLSEERGALPAVSFYTQIGIPGLASKDHKGKHVFPEIRLLFQNQLTDKLKVDYNIGPEWDGGESSPQWFYSVAPDIEIGEKGEVFMEVFGYIQSGRSPQHHLDGGFAYYPTNDIKLDIFGGIGLSKAAPDYFLSAGVSFRLKP